MGEASGGGGAVSLGRDVAGCLVSVSRAAGSVALGVLLWQAANITTSNNKRVIVFFVIQFSFQYRIKPLNFTN